MLLLCTDFLSLKQEVIVVYYYYYYVYLFILFVARFKTSKLDESFAEVPKHG
jgi:hypothetical protein